MKEIIEIKEGSRGQLLNGCFYRVESIDRVSFDTDGNFKKCTLSLDVEDYHCKVEIAEFIDAVKTIDNNDAIVR